MSTINSSWIDQTKRKRIIDTINKLRIKDLNEIKSIKVPEGLKGFGNIKLVEENCIACAACARICPADAIVIKKRFNLESIMKRWKKSNAPNRKKLSILLETLKQTENINGFNISPTLIGFGEVEIQPDKCTFCLDCIHVCGFEALKPELEWDLQKILKKSK